MNHDRSVYPSISIYYHTCRFDLAKIMPMRSEPVSAATSADCDKVSRMRHRYVTGEESRMRHGRGIQAEDLHVAQPADLTQRPPRRRPEQVRDQILGRRRAHQRGADEDALRARLRHLDDVGALLAAGESEHHRLRGPVADLGSTGMVEEGERNVDRGRVEEGSMRHREGASEPISSCAMFIFIYV